MPIQFKKGQDISSVNKRVIGGIVHCTGEHYSKRLTYLLGTPSSVRTGEKYAALPKVSSAEGQYPQNQSEGEESLMASVDYREVDDFSGQIGHFNHNTEKILALNFGSDVNGLAPRLGLDSMVKDEGQERQLLYEALKDKGLIR